MARISRRRGPTAAQGLTTTFTLISGLSVTRQFDDGEILIVTRMRVRSIGAVRALIACEPRFGNNPMPGYLTAPQQFVETGDPSWVGETFLQPISAGVQTITLFGFASVNGAFEAVEEGCYLIVIQLPQWDSESDIQGLV